MCVLLLGPTTGRVINNNCAADDLHNVVRFAAMRLLRRACCVVLCRHNLIKMVQPIGPQRRAAPRLAANYNVVKLCVRVCVSGAERARVLATETHTAPPPCNRSEMCACVSFLRNKLVVVVVDSCVHTHSIVSRLA